ncbi:MAG: hypothetical protein ACTSQ8_25335 [Candidatus Helarchaeota archaeon]
MLDLDISKQIKAITTREKMIRYLDGYSEERMEELDARKTKKPLVKSYMLEYVGHTGQQKNAKTLFNRIRIELEQIDDSLYRVRDNLRNNIYVGFLEVLSPRYFVFYTLHHSQEMDKWIKKIVVNSPDLDHIWLSGLTFNVLWERVIQITKPNRYANILFVHESIYDIDNHFEESEDDADEDITHTPVADDEESFEIIERRASKFRLVDKISVIQNKLKQLQDIYSPLYAISQLRFPSPVGKGGHDFYDYGKVTNRSGNFRDHRAHILYVQRIYDKLMKKTEEKAWYDMHPEKITLPGQFQKFIGAPVTILFSEPLNQKTFDYWIQSTFGRLNNRFRLWGNPIRLGPKKVHVYGIDRHLWKPIFLEITDKRLIAIVPKGTCGNTIHRLICNIQRYIDPAAKAFIGNEEYKNIVEESSQGVNFGP